MKFSRLTSQTSTSVRRPSRASRARPRSGPRRSRRRGSEPGAVTAARAHSCEPHGARRQSRPSGNGGAVGLYHRRAMEQQPIHEIFDQFKQQLPDIDPVETAGVARLAGCGRRGLGPGARPLHHLQAPEARPAAAGRPAAADPDPVRQHDLPRAGAGLPRRRVDRAPHPAHDPLERAGHGPAREHAATRASAGTCRPTPAPRACTRSASTTSSAAATATRPATRSSSRATPRRASTPAPSSRAASARSSSTTSGARRCGPAACRPTRTRARCPSSGSSRRSAWAWDR